MLKSFRYVLFPFTLLYYVIIFIRNYLFDKKVFKSVSFNFPIICVGNLAVGGTGKSPMTEYLIKLLQDKYKIATLSRGYKRKTKGFGIANENTTALDIGDEPMQFFEKFNNITVAVGEERLVAIPQILQEAPNTQVIIMDDGFQHRKVLAGLNIVLTDYSNLFTRDYLLPTGDLRDIKKSITRANIIVVTKCPSDLSIIEKQKIEIEINCNSKQKLFFSEIVYDKPYHLFTKQTLDLSNTNDVLLVVAIANPTPLKNYLSKQVQTYEMIRFSDHHIFTKANLDEISLQFDKLKSSNKILLTTEKDAVRLQKFKSLLIDTPIYVIPIKQNILFDEHYTFDNAIVEYINSYTTV